jgi:hypothetical protein
VPSTSDAPGRRRAPGSPRRLPDLPPRAALRGLVKTGAALGIAAGAVAVLALPAEVAPAQASASTVVVPDRSTGLAAASRSASRTSPRTGAAVLVDVGAPGAPARFGVTGVTAVAKPAPKPSWKPSPKPSRGTASPGRRPANASRSGAERAPAAAPRATRAAGGASAASTSRYAAAGAALGLVPSAQRVYSAIRSRFGITNIGGLRPGSSGDHGTGHAVDVMVTGSRGDAVAAYAIANAGSLNIKYVIWEQRIWQPGRGWKAMADRGSVTANHFDHVHISVN